MTPEERQHIESQIKKLKDMRRPQPLDIAMALQNQLNYKFPNQRSVKLLLQTAEELLSKGGK